MKIDVIINNLIKNCKTQTKNNFGGEKLIVDGFFEKLVKEKNDKKDTSIKKLNSNFSLPITNKLNFKKVLAIDLNDKLKKDCCLKNKVKQNNDTEKIPILSQNNQIVSIIVEKDNLNREIKKTEIADKLKVNCAKTQANVKQKIKLSEEVIWSKVKVLNFNDKVKNSFIKNVTIYEPYNKTRKFSRDDMSSILKDEQIKVEKNSNLKTADNMSLPKIENNLQNKNVTIVNHREYKDEIKLFKKIIEQSIHSINNVVKKSIETGLEEKLTIKLFPPNLGELNITAKIDKKDNLKIKITATSYETVNLLERSVEELKKELISVMREKTDGMEVFIENNSADHKSYDTSYDKSYDLFFDSISNDTEMLNKLTLPTRENEKNVYLV